ncbi:transcriptional regulator [Dongia sp.]|uniref:helix-turn-helix domain-containing protein n=1 Tax=Dongia sp. TaxID=1977262 RepID=UPI0035B0BB0B
MARKSRDLAPEEIRYRLNRKGLTFADIERQHGLKSGIARMTSRHPHIAGEQAIAAALGLAPHQIWPSRFDPETGVRLTPQPVENYRDRPRLRTSQKRKAA